MKELADFLNFLHEAAKEEVEKETIDLSNPYSDDEVSAFRILKIIELLMLDKPVNRAVTARVWETFQKKLEALIRARLEINNRGSKLTQFFFDLKEKYNELIEEIVVKSQDKGSSTAAQQESSSESEQGKTNSTKLAAIAIAETIVNQLKALHEKFHQTPINSIQEQTEGIQDQDADAMRSCLEFFANVGANTDSFLGNSESENEDNTRQKIERPTENHAGQSSNNKKGTKTKRPADKNTIVQHLLDLGFKHGKGKSTALLTINKVFNNGSNLNSHGKSKETFIYGSDGSHRDFVKELFDALLEYQNNIGKLQEELNKIGSKYKDELPNPMLGNECVKAYQLGRRYQEHREAISDKLESPPVGDEADNNNSNNHRSSELELKEALQQSLTLLDNTNTYSEALNDAIIRFFRNDRQLPLTSYSIFGTAFAPRATFKQSLEMTDVELESYKNYFQKWFPIYAKSKSHPNERPLNARVRAFLFENPHLQQMAFDRFIKFLGLERVVIGYDGNERPISQISRVDESAGASPAETFNARKLVWLTPNNHNFQRITRVLKSLAENGNEQLADALLKQLKKIKEDNELNPNGKNIREGTFKRWEEAVYGQESSAKVGDITKARLSSRTYGANIADTAEKRDEEEAEEEEKFEGSTSTTTLLQQPNEGTTQDPQIPIFKTWQWSQINSKLPSSHLGYVSYQKNNNGKKQSLDLKSFNISCSDLVDDQVQTSKKRTLLVSRFLDYKGARLEEFYGYDTSKVSSMKPEDKIQSCYFALKEIFNDFVNEQVNKKEREVKEKRSSISGEHDLFDTANKEATKLEEKLDPHIDRLKLMSVIMRIKFAAEIYLSQRIKRVNNNQIYQQSSSFFYNIRRNNAELAKDLSGKLEILFDKLNAIPKDDIDKKAVHSYLNELQGLLQAKKRHHHNSVADHLGLTTSHLKHFVLQAGLEQVEKFRKEYDYKFDQSKIDHQMPISTSRFGCGR